MITNELVLDSIKSFVAYARGDLAHGRRTMAAYYDGRASSLIEVLDSRRRHLSTQQRLRLRELSRQEDEIRKGLFPTDAQERRAS